MPHLPFRAAAVVVALAAVLYQYFAKSLIFDILGYGRVVQNVSAFSHLSCQKIDNLGLEGCEDMWLNDRNGFLYMSCSDSRSRVQWLPAMGHLNATGRSLTDRLVVLDTRGAGPLASRIWSLTPTGFAGIGGDGTLNLHGLDIWEDPEHNLHILLINHRPPLDPTTGQALDAANVGANSTIELFLAATGSDTMQHIKTYSHNSIQTPNDVAWVSKEGFVFTNDHSSKVGLRRELDSLLGGGSIGYCDQRGCKIAKDAGFTFPNGIVRGHDGFIYTPSAINGEVKVLSLDEHHLLTEVGSFKVPVPVDNLSVDKHGHMLAAGFPQVYKLLKSFKDPFGVSPPSAVFSLQRKERSGLAALGESGWHDGDAVVTKILEDDGNVISGVSIAVHDVEAGRIFLGGPIAPFISICQVVNEVVKKETVEEGV